MDILNEPYLANIIKSIEALKDNPRNINVKKLINQKNEYRLRSGDYRILFYIEEKEKIIKISRVLHRKDAYK